MEHQVNNLITIIILSAAISAFTSTMSLAGITVSMRDWLMGKNQFLGKLFSCPYCLSHYIALLIIIWYRPVVVMSSSIIIDSIISLFTLVAISAIMTGQIKRAFFAPPIIQPNGWANNQNN